MPRWPLLRCPEADNDVTQAVVDWNVSVLHSTLIALTWSTGRSRYYSKRGQLKYFLQHISKVGYGAQIISFERKGAQCYR